MLQCDNRLFLRSDTDAGYDGAHTAMAGQNLPWAALPVFLYLRVLFFECSLNVHAAVTLCCTYQPCAAEAPLSITLGYRSIKPFCSC